MSSVKKQDPYWEPDTVPEGAVRVRYNGPGGAITLLDYRGWQVRINTGQSVIVTEQAWKNLDDRELPGWRPGRWEKVG